MKQNNYPNFLDVHNLTLDNAITVIKKAVIFSYDNHISVLNINHGFNKGNKIKSWCRNNLKEMKQIEKIDSGENEGITKIYLKFKI